MKEIVDPRIEDEVMREIDRRPDDFTGAGVDTVSQLLREQGPFHPQAERLRWELSNQGNDDRKTS